MKKIFSYVGLALMMVLMTGVLTAAATPVPDVKFELVQGLPSTMNVGETYTAIVKVTSDTEYNWVAARPSFLYAGKGVVAGQGNGGERAGAGTEALLTVEYTAKSDTSKMPNGETTVYLIVGARFKGGYVASEQYEFNVTVPE
jgi:hypothetical protein